MTFIDFFAGVGGFHRGLELAGHKCVGFCEYDKFATASYISMHLLTEEQRESLGKLELKQRQKEILKNEYRNGEWYARDIRTVNAGDIPRADLWAFGFPCQDISVIGKMAGFSGNRSSLFFRVMQLIRDIPEEDRPKYLFIENVKNLLSINNGWDFAAVLYTLDECGYAAEWQVVNSKFFGVPQNRERVFIIGHSRNGRTAPVFPVGGSVATKPVKMIRTFDNLPTGEYGADYRYDEGIRIRGEKIYPCVTTRAGSGPSASPLYIKVNNTDIKVRKLTPRECWRLQGWTDDYFEHAQFVNGDQQLYKQAGNGVTVPVIQAIAERLEE